MTNNEAKDLLGLDSEYDKESLRLNYHAKFIDSYRQKSASPTLDEVKDLDAFLNKLNEAHSLLDKSEVLNQQELQFDFRYKKFEKKLDSSKSRRSIDNFDEHINNLIEHGRYGLALSLLEIGINLSLQDDSEVSMSSISQSINTLGRIMIELGLVSQGIKYYCFNKNDYDIGKAYQGIGNCKFAAHHFALELKSGKSKYPADDLCQKISICYFLLGDYQNAIKIVEEVLPKLLPKKSIFEESCKWKEFATAIMVSMYKLNVVKGKQFDKIRLRVKYPLCFKYLQNCYITIDAAWKVMEEFEHDNDLYETFLKKLGPKPFVKEIVNLEYSLTELQENFYDLFEQAMNKSLIYNPK